MASIYFFCYKLGDVSQTWRILIFGDYIFHSHAKGNLDAGQRDLTLFSLGFFFFLSSWARGGRRDTKCPHLRNSESIRAITTRLLGYIVWVYGHLASSDLATTSHFDTNYLATKTSSCHHVKSLGGEVTSKRLGEDKGRKDVRGMNSLRVQKSW